MFTIDLEPNERPFKIYRQSEWVLAKTVIVIFVALYGPWFLLVHADLFEAYVKWFLIWTLLLFAYGGYHYLLWMINSYVVTDKRLVVIKYQSLFKKHVTDCSLDRITNVSYATTGFFSSLLNFGNVEVLVSGLDHPLLLEHLRKPENLKIFLWSLRTHGHADK